MFPQRPIIVSSPTSELLESADNPTCPYPLLIYTGLLGQIGDIVMFSATLRRLRELFPAAQITFAVSERYRQAGELVAGLPYADCLFVTQLYFERLTPPLSELWWRGWPIDLRGEDEVVEQRQHDLVLETRPRHRRSPWREYAHQVEELAHSDPLIGWRDLLEHPACAFQMSGKKHDGRGSKSGAPSGSLSPPSKLPGTYPSVPQPRVSPYRANRSVR